MAMREQSRDLCGSFNLLGDLTKHFIHDETLPHEIIGSNIPVSDPNDLFCPTPETFNMHVLFHQIQDICEVNQNQATKLRSSSNDDMQYFPIQQYSLQPHQIHSLPAMFSHDYYAHFDNKLAKDIISNAPYISVSSDTPQRDPSSINNIFQTNLNDENCNLIISQNTTYTDAPEIVSCLKGETSCLNDNQVESNFWADLQLRWEALAKTDLESHPWLVNHEETEHELNYQFSVQKASIHGDLMKQGIELLSQGQLTLAIATFEAELQERPENYKAWLYLGSSQAENEQDELSISALRKCISLDPQNMDARLLLAVGYTNESKNRQACKILRDWLLNHPCFCILFPSEALNAPIQLYMPSFLDPKFHQEVVELFELALISPLGNSQEKGDLHVAAGILYHLVEQYSVSVSHFKTALSLQTDNPMLWNKLGATLANGDRSEEAVHAYKEALRLYPNYVRCRYNMGIACMNLKSFPEACEHFLIALKLQSQGRGPNATAWNLWNTLRLALMLGDMPHLFTAIDNRDLDSLLVEFHLCD